MCYAPAICSPCTWDREIKKILTFPSAKLGMYSLHYWDSLSVESLVTVPAHQHVPRTTSVFVNSTVLAITVSRAVLWADKETHGKRDGGLTLYRVEVIVSSFPRSRNKMY